MPIPLAAVPFTAAALAYLNARFGLVHDLGLIRNATSTKADFRRAERADKVNFFAVFEERARNKSTADHVFLIFEGQKWTYAAAHENCLRYGNWLRKQKGVRKGEVVAMDFTNTPAFIWIWFGLWSIGAKPACINYNLKDKPLLHTITVSKARLVLVEEALRENFAEGVLEELKKKRSDIEHSPVELLFFDGEIEREVMGTDPVQVPARERAGEKLYQPSMLIYTSGTTGMPKPAIMSWYKCRTGSGFVPSWVGFRRDDVVYTCMPLYHSSAAIMGCCAVVTAGATLALGRRFSQSKFWPEVCASGATIIQYVGETCRYLLSAPPSPLDKAHSVRVAYGNGMRPDVWRRFKDRFGIDTVAEFYAATECPMAFWNKSTSNFGEGAVGYFGTLMRFIGRGQTCLIEVDIETNKPVRDPKSGFCKRVPDNVPGEAIHRLDEKDIPASFQGYFGNSKATASKILRDVFRKGDAWYASGDIFKIDSDNRIFFQDRVGDTFRWKAENVSTAEVAQVLGTFPGLSEANVYGVELPNHDGRAGCAAVIVDDGKEDGHLLNQLAKHATAGLPRYAVPLFLRVANELQLTGTNKQQKHLLRETGVDPEKVAASGDRIYWLQNNTYKPFGREDWSRLQQGQVKL